MKKILLILSLLTAFFSNVFADTLRIGTLDFNPPFEMQTDKAGNFSGFEIDMTNEVCRRMQVDCQYIALPLDQLFTSLEKKQIDLAIGSINISLDRLKLFLFSNPYLPSSGGVMVTQKSKIVNIADLKGKKVGALAGSIYIEYLNKLFANNITIINLSADELLDKLSNNEIDAFVEDYYFAAYWAANSDNFKLLSEKITYGIGYGIMANLNSVDLINQINIQLENIQADGTFTKLYNKYLNF